MILLLPRYLGIYIEVHVFDLEVRNNKHLRNLRNLQESLGIYIEVRVSYTFPLVI